MAGARAGDCCLVRGAVGAGKSVFSRGLVRGLAGDADLAVTSPTYALVNVYDCPAPLPGAGGGGGRGEPAGLQLHHFDLYRLEGLPPERRALLGLREAMRGGAAVIEWPEYLAEEEAPAERLEVELGVLPGGGAGGPGTRGCGPPSLRRRASGGTACWTSWRRPSLVSATRRAGRSHERTGSAAPFAGMTSGKRDG